MNANVINIEIINTLKNFIVFNKKNRFYDINLFYKFY